MTGNWRAPGPGRGRSAGARQRGATAASLSAAASALGPDQSSAWPRTRGWPSSRTKPFACRVLRAGAAGLTPGGQGERVRQPPGEATGAGGAGTRVTPAVLGGRSALEITPEGGAAGGTIIYFHGGVWVVGSPATAQQVTSALVSRTGARAVSLDYQLAPEHSFPAAIEDAAAAYRDLLENGTPAEQIVLAGDSAGEG